MWQSANDSRPRLGKLGEVRVWPSDNVSGSFKPFKSDVLGDTSRREAPTGIEARSICNHCCCQSIQFGELCLAPFVSVLPQLKGLAYCKVKVIG